MNKRFSTLIAAFAAFATVSFAQDTYVQLVNGAKGALSWTGDVPEMDSVKFKAVADLDTKLLADSALWKVDVVRVETGGDSICTFTNKATNKMLSFAKKEGATMKIAEGVSEFVYKNSGSTTGLIYASIGDNKVIYLSKATDGKLVNTATAGADTVGVAITAAPVIAIDDFSVLTALNTIKLSFNGKEGGLFTEAELVPTKAAGTADKFKFQVVGKEKSSEGTGQAQYITLDTVKIAGNTVNIGGFMLDTLVVDNTADPTVSQYKGLGNAGLQAFNVRMDLGRDSLILTTDTLVTFADGDYTYQIHGANTNAANAYVVGFKTLTNSEVLAIDSAKIRAAFITLEKGTPVKLAGGTGIYSIQLKANGGNSKVAQNDLCLTATNSSTYAYDLVADSVSAYVPMTQMYVKENEDGTYTIQARETRAVTNGTASVANNGATIATAIAGKFIENAPLYKAGDNYAILNGSDMDTVVFTKLDVDMANKHIGYKYYTKEEMGYGAVKFNLASKAADDIYLALAKDTVIAGSKGVDKAVELRLIEGSNLAADTVSYGAQALGDTLVRVAYAMQKAYNPDSRQFTYDDASVRLSNDGAVTGKRFFFAVNPAGESYKVVNAGTADGKMVTLNISNLAVTYDKPVAGVETYFNIEGAEAPVYAKVDAGHYNVVNGSEMLTASAGIAKLLRVGDELKAAAADSDFSLFVDSAYVNRGDDNTEYGYYIYKGAEVKNDTIVGNVLAAKGDFVANNATGDSAIFRGVTVVADTIAYTGDLDNKSKQKTYTVRNGNNTSLVGFKVVDGEGYEIVALNTNKSLAVVNGTVIFSNTVAPQVFTLGTAEAPTANEGVEVSEVTVIAGEGQVTIAGAAGKKVVVSNILGQTVANTVITSDNAVIAAPQGVVVVAVEGEEAVKAIVK